MDTGAKFYDSTNMDNPDIAQLVYRLKFSPSGTSPEHIRQLARRNGGPFCSLISADQPGYNSVARRSLIYNPVSFDGPPANLPCGLLLLLFLTPLTVAPR